MDTPTIVDGRLSPSVDINTVEFSPKEQFEVFRDAHRDVTDLNLVKSIDASFPARQVAWDLGRLVLTCTELPGSGYVHRWRHLSKAIFDHWYVTVRVRPSENGRGLIAIEAPSLHCLATPHGGESEDFGRLGLFMPRDLFPSMSAAGAMLDVPLGGGCGFLLGDYLVLLSRFLPQLKIVEVPHVVEATRCLIAACLVPSRDRLVEAQRPVDIVLLERARGFVGRKLTDPTLTPDMLCIELGVSRSRLYRLFQSLGGISAYIRRQRLLKTRDALSNNSDRRSISQIAEEWGFMDPSAYSRMFRHEFGMSPSDARNEGWRGSGYLVGQQKRRFVDQEASLASLLQALSA
jgi:AraC-like DNA-binding protein